MKGNGKMKKSGLSQEWLKVIACVTMLIDHIGAVLVPQSVFLRCVGRIAFPIYCFLLAEGVHFTKNPKKYALRLGMGVVLAEIPFDLAVFGRLTVQYQSVMLTLFIAFCMAITMKRVTDATLRLVLIIPFAMAAECLGTDYGGMGVILVALFVLTRELNNRGVVQFLGMALILWLMDSGQMNVLGIFLPIEMLALLSIIPICLYNGKKSTASPALQTAFYLFYPVHLVILHLIRCI